MEGEWVKSHKELAKLNWKNESGSLAPWIPGKRREGTITVEGFENCIRKEEKQPVK